MTALASMSWATTPSRLPADFVRLMSDRILIWQQTGQDAYSKPTYGQSVSARCRIDSVAHEYRTVDGLTRTYDTMIILDRYYGIKPQDKIQLPNGDQPTIVTVSLYSDEHGPLYESIATSRKS